MPSTFFTFNIARRAMEASRLAMDVIGHNIANADTEGYNRQVVSLRASIPYTEPSLTSYKGAGQIGTGVDVHSITRMRDVYVARLINQENQAMGKWNTRNDVIGQIEMTFGEPSDNGIASQLDLFFAEFQKLSRDPDNTAVRAETVQQAYTLAERIRQVYGQLKDLNMNVTTQASVFVNEVNTIAVEIADLNRQISKVLRYDQQPNDLMDRRDLLTKRLAELVNISVEERDNGEYDIYIKGIAIVQGSRARSLEIEVDQDTGFLSGYRWKEEGLPAEIDNGKLGGLLECSRDVIPKYTGGLNEFAKGLANAVNEIHRRGFDLYGDPGIDFFVIDPDDPEPAENITINSDLNPDIHGEVALNRIAASSIPEMEGNGAVALEIAQLSWKPSMLPDPDTGEPTSSLNDFYNSMISRLGVEGRQAQKLVDNQTAVMDHLQRWYDSTSSVSLDEEMMNLVRYQHSYSAAARVITVVDEMLELVINRLGVVGR